LYIPNYTKRDEVLIQIAVRNYPSNISVVILLLPNKFELTDKRRVCETILNTMELKKLLCMDTAEGEGVVWT
jgi:hypothetical protein